MASIKLKGDTSGEVTISSPAVAGTTTLELPATSSTLATENALGVRNLIINGDMRVHQRGGTISGITSTKTYTLDRWFGRSLSTSSMSVSQSTDAPDGFLNSAKCQKPSGQTATVMRFEQPFETKNIVHLRGQKVTVSFYAKKGADYSPTDDEFPIVLYAGNGTERARNITAFDNESVPLNTSVTLTSTWQRFSVTSSTLPSDLSQLALQFQPVTRVTAGADESFYITGVQLEVGDTATPFEHRPYDMELARCQRYYFKLNPNNIRYAMICPTAYTRSSTTVDLALSFPVTMRDKPSSVSFSTIIFRRYDGSLVGGSFSALSLDTNTITPYNALLNATVSTGTPGHTGSVICNNNVNGYLAISAEL